MSNNDYLSRAAAVARLSPYIGDNLAREYLQKLLTDKLNVNPITQGVCNIREIKE